MPLQTALVSRSVELAWHEGRRLANLAKHGLDFVDATKVFDGAHIVEPARSVGDERRSLAIGECDGRLVAVVYTLRVGRIRIISMRKGRDDERRRYQAVYG